MRTRILLALFFGASVSVLNAEGPFKTNPKGEKNGEARGGSRGEAVVAGGPETGGPANDLCADSIVIFDGNTPFDTRGAATDGPEEPTCNFEFNDSNINNDIWFDYAASCNGDLVVSLCGTAPTTQGGFDTKVAVYRGLDCPPGAAPIACNDDGCPAPSALASIVAVRALRGQEFKIRIGGFLFDNTEGPGLLNVRCVPDVPECAAAAGDCCSAHSGIGCDDPTCCETVCTLMPSCCGGDWTAGCANTASDVCTVCGGGSGAECEQCILVHPRVAYTGSTAGATGTNESSCGGAGDTADVWHCWTADCDGTATIRLCNADFDTTLAVFDACDGAEVACDDETPCSATDLGGSRVRFSATEGSTYRVRVAGAGGATGDYTLESSCDVGPANDTCGNSLSIELGATEFNTVEATTDGPTLPPACDEFFGVLMGKDIWYDFVSPCTGLASFSTCNAADFDTRLALYEECTCPVDNSRLTACNDDASGCELHTSELTAQVVQGLCYKLRVGGYQDFGGTASGAGTLSVTCGAPAPNDNCEDAAIATLPNTFTGSNENASNDCSLFPGSQVWIAFRLTTQSNVTLSYCGSEPAFDNAWLNLTRSCPCATFTNSAASCESCPDGNPMMKWFCLPAGEYYYPVLSERGSRGEYQIRVESQACTNNNACAAALPIGDGVTGFNSTGATTDGPALPASCDEGQGTSLGADVWYNYVATCDGMAVISTCLAAEFDTRLALYIGTACPVSNGRLLGWNDNGLDCDDTSILRVPVSQGQGYKLRVGGRGVATGVGCIDVECQAPCSTGNVSSDPESGTIDARQSELPLRGIREIRVTADEGADAACFTLCDTSTGGLCPIGIFSAIFDEQYIVELTRPISPFAVTTLSLGNMFVELTSHPGNVNGDGFADSADVTALRSFLQGGTPLYGLLSVDINGSGEFNILDLPALLDQLNGAGDLTAANGTPRPGSEGICP